MIFGLQAYIATDIPIHYRLRIAFDDLALTR